MVHDSHIWRFISALNYTFIGSTMTLSNEETTVVEDDDEDEEEAREGIFHLASEMMYRASLYGRRQVG